MSGTVERGVKWVERGGRKREGCVAQERERGGSRVREGV